jgi:hypothetical protein
MDFADRKTSTSFTIDLPSPEFNIAALLSGDENGEADHWVVVAGRVVDATGLEWQFADPALTRDEVAALSDWLHRIEHFGVIPLNRTDFDLLADEIDRNTSTLGFIEPLMTFALERYTESGALLRVDLDYEALPPALRGAGPISLVFDVDFDLIHAAWRSLLTSLEALDRPAGSP